MTNPPDPKTKTPRTTEALAKLNRWKARSDAATMRGSHLDSDDPKPPDGWEFASTLELENQSLTRRLEEAEKERDAIAQLLPCGFYYDEELTERVRLLVKQWNAGQAERDQLTANLTALRTAAEGARDALKGCLNDTAFVHARNPQFEEPAHRYANGHAALAALRAELDQADSNASNSPTASRESQG